MGATETTPTPIADPVGSGAIRRHARPGGSMSRQAGPVIPGCSHTTGEPVPDGSSARPGGAPLPVGTGGAKRLVNSADAKNSGTSMVMVTEKRDMPSSLPPRSVRRYRRTGDWG